MRKFIPAVVCIAVGIFALVMPASSDTVHPPNSARIGIFVDSYNGDSKADINCFTEGSDGRFTTGVDGDATLFMENRKPHTIVCTINLKKATLTI